MGIRTLLYLFRLGLKNLWHHRVYTAASVITMSACIFLFGLFYLAAANVDSMVKKTEQEVYVAVFFDEGILPERVEEIGNLIQSRPEVLRTVYVSADEAWSGFKEKYYENAEALDGIFETDNPLASSGNYQVYIDRIGSQEGFVEYVQSIEGVIKTFFDNGGEHIQINVVDDATLKDAQIHPEHHKGLMVRVAGYMAYFTELDKSAQDTIIYRTTHFKQQ